MFSELRKHLRTLDAELANRADFFWSETAKELHSRQTRPGESIGGADHVGKVEHNVWRLIHESGRTDAFTKLDWFILSVAAGSHDFDKGLRKEWRERHGHGAGSGRFVVQNAETFGLAHGEAVAIDHVDSLHDLRGEAFTNGLCQIPSEYFLQDGKVDLQRLAVILKAADTLHTDSSRVSSLAQEPDHLTEKDRSKFNARKAITGWGIRDGKIVIQAYPQQDQLASVRVAFEMIKEHDWQPIARDMHHYVGVSRLELDLRDRYLASPASSNVESGPPEMDFYGETQAAYFAGRDAEVDKLLTLVVSNQHSRLIGPSGVGKSSLLRAGLIPHAKSLTGWKFLITRPDRPKNRFYTSADFGISPGPTSDFTSACRQALDGHQKLVVIFDQFEDIAYYGSFDVDAIAAELHSAQRGVGFERLHYLYAYRDDVESLLGPLWNALTSSSRPPSTEFIQRLDRKQARAALVKVLEHSKLTTDPASVERLLDGLVQATRRESSLTIDAVYPPYIQMVARRLLDFASSGTVDITAFEQQAGAGKTAVDVALGGYLQRAIESLDHCAIPPGGKPGGITAARAKAILYALARSSGTKATAPSERLAAEARVPSKDLPLLLGEMASRRLIRRLPDGQWEIIHDFLARDVIESCESDEERRFKQAREALQAAAQSYRAHETLLNRHQLRELWLARDRLPASTLSLEEQLVLLVSIYFESCNGRFFDFEWGELANFVPGWFWLSELQPDELDSLLATASRTMLRSGRMAAITYARIIGRSVSLPWLREIGNDHDEEVFSAAVEAIGGLATRDDLPWLKEAFKKGKKGARGVALEACSRLVTHEDLPWLKEVAWDDERDIAIVALNAAGKVITRDDLQWLRVVAGHNDLNVRAAAVGVAGTIITHADLPWLFQLYGKRTTSNLFNSGFRRSIARAVARVATREDLLWLQQAWADTDSGVREVAIEATQRLITREHLSWLQDTFKNQSAYVRASAVEVVAGVATRDELCWFQQAFKDSTRMVRRAAAEAIARIARPEDLPWLKSALTDIQSDVREVIVRAIGRVGTHDDLPQLQAMLKDENDDVRNAAVEAAGNLATREDIPWLRQAMNDGDAGTRRAAIEAIGKVAEPEDLVLLQEFLGDPEWVVRQEAFLQHAKQNLDDRDLLNLLERNLMSAHPEASAAAALLVCLQCEKAEVLAFLASRQNTITNSALAVFDRFLYAPEPLLGELSLHIGVKVNEGKMADRAAIEEIMAWHDRSGS